MYDAPVESKNNVIAESRHHISVWGLERRKKEEVKIQRPYNYNLVVLERYFRLGLDSNQRSVSINLAGSCTLFWSPWRRWA